MFDVKDKRILPYKMLLFGALGLYLWRLNRIKDSTKVSIDTDKLASAAMPYIPVNPSAAHAVKQGLKNTLDIVFERIRK